MFNILVSQFRSNLIDEAHFNKNMRFSGGLFCTMLLSQRLSGVRASNQCFKLISLLAEQPMLPPVKVVNIAKILYIYIYIYGLQCKIFLHPVSLQSMARNLIVLPSDVL